MQWCNRLSRQSKTLCLIAAGSCRDGPEMVRFVGIDVLPEEVLEEAKASLLSACPGLRPANVVMISADYVAGIPLAVQRYDVLLTLSCLLRFVTYCFFRPCLCARSHPIKALGWTHAVSLLLRCAACVCGTCTHCTASGEAEGDGYSGHTHSLHPNYIHLQHRLIFGLGFIGFKVI